MDTPTETKAITPYEKLRNSIRLEDTQARFKEVLGERAPAFLASVLSTVHTTDTLRDCEPNSIIVSAMKAAVLDLPVDPNIGHAYLIPFRDHGVKKAQFQIGYKGFIQLALRSGMYQLLNVTELYRGEQIDVDRLTGKVKLTGEKTSDEVTGYVAYFKLSTGFEKFIYMSKPAVAEHAKKYSKSYGDDRSAWTTHFDAMAKKTVLKQLLTKYGIMSISLQKIIQEDQEAEEVAAPFAPAVVVLEGEFTDTLPESEPPDEYPPPMPEDPPESEPEAAPPAPDLAEEVVAAGLSENIHAARKTLQKCTVEPTLEWFRLYRGWRDLGGTSDQAAKKANAGQVPG